MAIGNLTYLDIPEKLRREAATKTRMHLRSLLANPAYTPEQRAQILAQIAQLADWESGKIPVNGATAAPQSYPPGLFNPQ